MKARAVAGVHVDLDVADRKLRAMLRVPPPKTSDTVRVSCLACARDLADGEECTCSSEATDGAS